MNGKKIITSLIAILVLAGLGVGGYYYYAQMQKANSDNIPEAVMNDRTCAIYFGYSDESLTDVISKAAVDYGEQAGIYVFPVFIDEGEYLEAINERTIRDNQPIDAYLISNESLEKAYLAGLAVEIDDSTELVNDENFGNAALAAVTYKDKKIGYPFSYETSALLYNETYLHMWANQKAAMDFMAQGVAASEEEIIEAGQAYIDQIVPKTLAEILALADGYDAPDGVEAILSWDVSDIFYNYWIVGDAMVVGGENGDDKTQISVDNENTRACLKSYQSLHDFFSIESKTVDYDVVLDDFLSGKTVFTIATTDAVSKMEEKMAAEDNTFRFAVSRMPEISDEYASRSMSVTNVVAVNGYSEHKDYANGFAAYLCGGCANDLYARTGRPSANIHADPENELLSVFAQEYADSIPLPKMIETENFWIQLETVFAAVWDGEDVEQQLRDLENRVNLQMGNNQGE